MPRPDPWIPSAEQMAQWPAVSGNAINGVGETAVRRPTPVYWFPPDDTPHGPLQRWFLGRLTPKVLAAREVRQRLIDAPLPPLATTRADRAREAWSAEMKAAARAAGADDVGIARMQPHWVYEGCVVPERFAILLAVSHDWDALRTAPAEDAAAEVIRQYGRAIHVAKQVAGWLREQGHAATPHGGPLAPPMLLVPAAIAAGLGELGKHGSIINRHLGSNFRLSAVLTDVPLVPDAPDAFGADDFCRLCRACADACPPRAITHEQRVVRGETKWYVDFDRCLPFFNEHQGCAVCLAACPWNRPGVAESLVQKLADRAARRRGAAA